MERGWVYTWLIAGYALLLVVLHLLNAFGVSVGIPFDTVILIVTFFTPAIAVAAGIGALSYFGLKTIPSRGVIALMVGITLWLLADVYWTIVGADALSFADIFYIVGYVCMFIATIVGILTVKQDFFRSWKPLTVFFIGLLFVIALFLLFPLGWDFEASAAENVVTAGYVFIDFLLFVPILFIIYYSFAKIVGRPWLFVAIGLLFQAAADIYYALFTDTYASGSLVDLGWYAAYLFFALGFIMLRMKTEELLAKS